MRNRFNALFHISYSYKPSSTFLSFALNLEFKVCLRRQIAPLNNNLAIVPRDKE
jgi:hypothetical protein